MKKSNTKDKKKNLKNNKFVKSKDTTLKKNKYNKLNNYKEYENLQIEGRNSVLEAINANKAIDKIFVKKGEVVGSLGVIIAKSRERGIIVQEIDRTKMEQISRTNNCQGVIAICPAHQYCEVYDIINKAKEKNEDPFIIVLDEITDPYNLGAIIRTADASGAHGVIIPKRRAVGLTAIVSKTSCGAIEHVAVAKVTNIAKEIEKLKKLGIWAVCADTKGTEYFNADLSGGIALVIGNEGNGVSRFIRQICDYSVKIPMLGKIESLNASVAAGIIMYEVVRQRRLK